MNNNKAQKASDLLHDTRVEAAKRLYRERRFRSEFFPDSDIFGEPAWDIMLHLFQGHAHGRGVKIESIAITTGLPATTSLRWLELLESKGLVFAYREESEIARIYLRLSSQGYEEMAKYLDRIVSAQPTKSR